MAYSSVDYGYILYNNRSTQGVVRNFLPKLDIKLLLDVESKLRWAQSLYETNKFVTIDPEELDLTGEDVIVTKDDVKVLKDIVLDAHQNISRYERNWLHARGIDDVMINRYKLGGLSCITDRKQLEILGVTIHPILRPIMKEGLGAGILCPLFDQTYPLPGNLINCAVRRIEDEGKLKYTHTCPDIDIWGFDRVFENSSVWMCEGVFDMMAIKSIGLTAISACSGMWSAVQLTRLIEKNPGKITIWVDRDETGMRNSAITKRLLGMYGFKVNLVMSKYYKDAAEHMLEKNGYIHELEELDDITPEMIEQNQDNSFDFLAYLKNREF